MNLLRKPITQKVPKFNKTTKKWALFLYRRNLLNWTNTMAIMNRSNFHMLSTDEFSDFLDGIIKTENFNLFDIGAGNGSGKGFIFS